MVEFYTFKEPSLWLEQRYDDLHNEVIDNSPKLSFIVALNWYFYTERPHTYVRSHANSIYKKYYKSFSIVLYFGYRQFHLQFKYKAMPYKNIKEYKDWRNLEKSN